MALSDRDRALGMDRPITRRDFLNGVALTVGATALSSIAPHGAFAATPASDPAKLGGLRGHSETAMSVMHAVRDGTFWESAPAPTATGETYDLVVVGGGISGLTAALLYRQQKPEAKILILENNEEFGGHAQRNEFTASNGKRIIGYGGSQSLQTPSFWSPLVNQVIADVGIETAKFEEYFDSDWHDRLGVAGDGQFYGAELFGADALVVPGDDTAWVAETPLNDQAKADLVRITDAPEDYLPGKTREEKRAALAGITYAAFLQNLAKCDPQVALSFTPDEYLATTADCYPALDAWAMGYPGFDAMDLGDAPDAANMPSARLVATDPDEYIYHFPDGNAGLARALVRALIPDAVPGSTMEDLVTATVDYTAMDRAENPVRLRLGSSVVKVAHDGHPASAETVTLTYVEEGTLKTVTGSQVVLACWHRVIPYITDELPAAQVEALNDQVKTPLVYANVLIRNFESFAKLGIAGFSVVPGFWSGVWLDDPVSIGDYQCPQSPADPVVLHVWSIPGPADGSSARDQSTAGRYQLTTMTFEDMERGIRDLLQRALGPAGFDAPRDNEAINSNRWSHGYALEYMRPWDAYWPAGPLPIETARQGWGRIAIANSDSGAYAYAHSAIDQAGRAVNDLIGGIEGFSTFPGPPAEVVP
jgi:spermidine dehydrogenase